MGKGAAACYGHRKSRGSADEVQIGVQSSKGTPAAGGAVREELLRLSRPQRHRPRRRPGSSALRDKDVDYFAKNILDPSAVIEPKFVAYTLRLKDRRVLSGLIQNETPTSLKLVSGNGVTETVARASIADIRAAQPR